jgi:uncharacterized protein YfaS (alpha-2-macroglobulin family)
VQVSAALTGGMGRALFAPNFSQLALYQYDGNEDFALWLRANAALSTVPRALTGLSENERNALGENARVAIEYLRDNQLGDGGWPWFNGPLSQSDPVITADVIQALIEAHNAGYTVPWGAVSRGKNYLMGQLQSNKTLDHSSRVHVIMALARAGEDVSSYGEHVFHNTVVRSRLGADSIAELAMSLARLNERTQVATLVSQLDSMAMVSATGAHWEDASAPFEFYGQSDVSTTADVLGTIVRLRPHDPFAPAAARWLMAARQGDEWDCQHDTAAALVALAAYARAAHEGTADYRYAVALRGHTRRRSAALLTGRYTTHNLTQPATTSVPAATLQPGQQNALDVSRLPTGANLGPGPLYYVARLRYYLPAGAIPSVSEGLTISRQYHDLHGHRITSVRAGTLIRVVLRLHSVQSLHYLQISDPLPSGLEPMDVTLKTSQQGVGPSVRFPRNVFDLSWFTANVSLYDDHAALDIPYLPPGTYTYSYLAQATRTGRYGVPPTHAEETFFPEVFGHGAGEEFTVTAR